MSRPFPRSIQTQDIVKKHSNHGAISEYGRCSSSFLLCSPAPTPLIQQSAIVPRGRPRCCETSAPHSLFLSFFSISSFLCIHTHRTFFLMTDGKSTIVRHQSLKTHTHTHAPHAHTNKHHLLVLLSLCAQSPVRCLDLFLTAECMHKCVSLFTLVY